MVVHAEDLVAGKIVCQLKLAAPETVRATLRTLAKAAESPAATLLNLLLSQGALDRTSRARAHHYAKLYQSARVAALEVALLKQQNVAPDAIVDRALAEVERGKFEKRVGDTLVQMGELGRAQDQRLVEQISRTLATEDAKLVSGYTSADYEGVARSITKDRSAHLDTGQFTVKKLFRSKESQRLAKLSAMQASRDENISPPTLMSPPSMANMPQRMSRSSATPLPSDRTPPPPYALPGAVTADGGGEQTFAAKGLERPALPPPPVPAPSEVRAQDSFDPSEATGELNFNRVGPYLILRKLGQGESGPVYLARRPDLTKPVALKVAPVGRRDEVLARFRKAADLARDVRHESIVSVLDCSEHQGLPLLASEYVTGDSLQAIVERDGALSEARSLVLATDLLTALAAVHAASLVHGDVTGEGVIVTTIGGRPKAKLPDLGYSVHTNERGPHLAEPRTTYASPEALLGETVDARSDIYSVGLILFVALTARFPFAKGSPDELREQKLSLAARTLGQTRPDRSYSPAVEELVARILSREKTQRPPSASRALKAIGDVVLPGLQGKPDTARLGARFDALFRE